MSLKKLVKDISESKRGPGRSDGAMKIVISGGEAFEAAAACMAFRAEYDAKVVYFASGDGELPDAFGDVSRSPRFATYRVSACAAEALLDILRFEQPDAVLQFDNRDGAFEIALIDAAGSFWSELAKGRKDAFRFVHAWTQTRNQEAAHGAAEPHISARFADNGFPALTVRCAPAYGPFQSPAAVAPLWITNAALGRELMIAGLGLTTTPWLYVDDLARGLLAAVASGIPGRRYGLANDIAASDLEVVHLICEMLDTRAPRGDGIPHAAAISMDAEVELRSASLLDAPELAPLAGWRPEMALADGLAMTVEWYAANASWWLPMRLAAVAAPPPTPGAMPASGQEAAA